MKIEGYENYEVTTTGEVINTKTGRVLKSGKNTCGYLHVVLCKNGKTKIKRIHRLVAEAFIPNPDNLPCVNHKDENKTNNCVDNLEWCTHEYNINYGTHNKRMTKTKSKPILQLRKDGSLVRIWPSASEVHKVLNYSQGHISECCRGERHLSYGYKWCYAN